MARRPKKADIPIDGDKDWSLKTVLNDRLIETIKKNIGLDTLSFEAKGMFTTSVKYKTGGYKTKPVDKGEDFALTDVRMGARDQVIFCFRPIMAKDYETMEIDESKVFGVFEGFEAMVVKSIGLTPAPRLADGSYGDAYTWKSGREHWSRIEHRALLAVKEEKLARKEEKKQAEVKRVTNDYSDNPLFGSW